MPNNLSQSGSRLVRLLLFLIGSEEGGVSREEVYNAIPGYDNEATRSRIFEQDLSCLEASGVQISRSRRGRYVEYRALLPDASKI